MVEGVNGEYSVCCECGQVEVWMVEVHLFSVGAGALVAWCGEIRDEVIKRRANGAGELCIEQRPHVIRGLLRPATVVVQQDERDDAPIDRKSMFMRPGAQ